MNNHTCLGLVITITPPYAFILYVPLYQAPLDQNHQKRFLSYRWYICLFFFMAIIYICLKQLRMIASTNSEKRINWYYWQTNRKKTFFRYSIVMKACIGLSCIRFCFIFKIFFIVDWFEIKSFFSYYCWLYPWLYYVFLAIHHLF